MDYTVLELLEKSPTGLKNSVIKSLIYQSLKAINNLHKNSIIHRDIKPENLLVDKKNHLKLCDFGFSRKFESFPLTDYVSTRWYRSPELLLYDGEYEKPADIWGLGCVMAELIDGNPLFEGRDQIHQLNLICKLLGPLPPVLREKLMRTENKNLRLPQFKKTNTLENRFKNFKDKKGLDLLKRMLFLDPNLRITTKEALTHPYFDNIREYDIKNKINDNFIRQEQIIKDSKDKINEIRDNNYFKNHNYNNYNNKGNINIQNNFNFFQIDMNSGITPKKYKITKLENKSKNYTNYNNNNHGHKNNFNFTINKNQNILNKKDIMLISTVKPNMRKEEPNDKRITMKNYGNGLKYNHNKINTIKYPQKKKELIKANSNNKMFLENNLNKNNYGNGTRSIEKYLGKQKILPNIRGDYKIYDHYKVPYKKKNNYY